MKIRIQTREVPAEGYMGPAPKPPYGRLLCGDHQYVRFLEGIGAPRAAALRFARDIEVDLPPRKPVVTRIPFLGGWVPFVLPARLLRQPVWRFEQSRGDIGLEWTLNNEPVGLEVYSPTDWSCFSPGIANLFVGGHGWTSNERYLPGEIRRFRDLSSLGLANCPRLTTLDNLSTCGQLAHLSLSAPNVVNLDFLRMLPVETLVLMDMERIDNLDFLRHLGRVRTLVVRNCRRLADLSGLEGHPSLRHLLLESLPARNLDPVGTIPALESLHLAGLPKARTLPAWNGLKAPGTVVVRDCPMLAEPDPANGLLAAPSLRFENFHRWDWERILGECAPQRLALVNCGLNDRSLAGLPTTPRLTHLDLSDNLGITRVKPLLAARNLRGLVLDNCKALRSLGGLGRFRLLEELSLTLCTGLASLQSVAGCTRLLTLSLAGLSPPAQQARWLRGLREIRELSLAGWDRVADFRFLGEMREAYYLDLRGRIFQEASPSLKKMSKLCYLVVTFIPDLFCRDKTGRPEHLRPTLAIPGTPGSEMFTSIREGWWDLPRDRQWNPGLLMDEGHSPELTDRMRDEMSSLMPRRNRERKTDFFGCGRPRPGSPPDLDWRKGEPPTPQAGTPRALIEQLHGLTWANNPFEAGNGHTRLAWELALEFEENCHGPAADRRNPDGSPRHTRHILRELVQALDGVSAPRPGGGPKPPKVTSFTLSDPDRPRARMEVRIARDRLASSRVIRGALREAAHHNRMRGRARPRATLVTPLTP